MTQTPFRTQIDEYTNEILNVIKAEYRLKNKSDALNKFVLLYGKEVLEKKTSPEFVEDVLSLVENHKQNRPKRKMSIKALNNL